jgi:hypothetical protein
MSPSEAKLPKILRIGVIQGGKIIEERLLKRRETVSVGSSTRSTLVLSGTGVPSSFVLFELRGGTYHLHFTDQMEGKLSTGEGPQTDFQSLVAQGFAKRHDSAYVLPLTDASRGKVSLGETTLLFQFVAPPPEPARPVLPETARGGWWRTVDRLFFGLLMCSVLAHYGLIAAVSGRDVSDEVTLDEIPDRFAKLVIPEKPITPPKPKEAQADTAAEKKADKAKEAPKKVVKKEEDEAAKAAAAAARHAKLGQMVAQKGLLKLLGADTGGGAGAIDDVLGSGGASNDIAAALAGAGGVSVAGADSIGAGGRKGGGAGKTAGIGDLATAGGGNVGLGHKGETRIAASVSASAPEVESSTLDRNAVSRFVKSRLKAIQGCYERELKLNPALKGKLAVRITITTQGKVGETEIDEDTLHNDAVVSCIKSLIRFWTFPFKPESDAAVQFSWNFVASQ